MTKRRATKARPKTYCRVDGGTMIRSWISADDIARIAVLLDGCEQRHYVRPTVPLLLRAGLKALAELYAVQPERAERMILGART